MLKNEQTPLKQYKWEEITSLMSDRKKVYNQLLQARYALENNLLSIEIIQHLEKLLEQSTVTVKKRDLHRPHEGAAFTIHRFLKTVVDLAKVISYIFIT